MAVGAEAVAVQDSFAGGLNLRDSPAGIAPDEARKMVNVILNDLGGANKRPGSTLVKTLTGGSTRVLSQHTFYRGFSAPQHIVHLNDGTVKYSNDLSTYTNITTGKSSSVPYAFEVYNELLLMSNGVDNFASWDGTNYVEYAGNPKATIMRAWAEALWIAGIPNEPDLVRSSAAGDPTTFPVGNQINIGKGDGGFVTALWDDQETLIVFKDNEHFVMYDPVNFFNRRVDPINGACSRDSVVAINGSIFFCTHDGIYLFTGNGVALRVSGKVDPVFNQSILNHNKLTTITSYRFEDHIGWALPEVGQSTPSFQVGFYPFRQTPAFVIHRMPAMNFTTWRDSDDEKLLYGRRDANTILEAFKGGTDDGTTFGGMIETGWTDFGAPIVQKYLRWLSITARGTLNVSILKDYESGVGKLFPQFLSEADEVWNGPGDVWDDGVWGPTSSYVVSSFHPDLYGHQFSLRFSDMGTAAGSQPVDIGGANYTVGAGSWGVYKAEAQVIERGDRV